MKSYEIKSKAPVWCTSFELSRNCRSLVRNAPPFLGNFVDENGHGGRSAFISADGSRRIAYWSFDEYEFFTTYEEAAEYYNKCIAEAQSNITHVIAETTNKLERVSKRLNGMYVTNDTGGTV